MKPINDKQEARARTAMLTNCLQDMVIERALSGHIRFQNGQVKLLRRTNLKLDSVWMSFTRFDAIIGVKVHVEDFLSDLSLAPKSSERRAMLENLQLTIRVCCHRIPSQVQSAFSP
jgi:hypothetical protein